jgi:hypothetical protein
MARNRVFTEHDIEAIVTLIRDWPKETIAWQTVCEKAEPILGYTPSRQGLSQHEVILVAFQARKRNLRLQPQISTPMPSSLAIAAQRISRLQAENSELILQIKALRHRFRIWQYNAHARNMTEADLDRPLPIIDKEVAASEKDQYGRIK